MSPSSVASSAHTVYDPKEEPVDRRPYHRTLVRSGVDVRLATDVDWQVHSSRRCSPLYFDGCFSVFGAAWVNGARDAGDLFRLGDGNGDGRIDLFYARPTGMKSRGADQVTSGGLPRLEMTKCSPMVSMPFLLEMPACWKIRRRLR